MFEEVVAAAIGASASRREELTSSAPTPAEPTRTKPTPTEPTPAGLLERIADAERAVALLQAAQARDLARLNAACLADEAGAATTEPSRDGRAARRCAALRAGAPAVSAVAAVEVATALRIAVMTAQCRLTAAVRAVNDHPELLDRLGTGRVSMAGLGRVLEATTVLAPQQQRLVDSQLAAEADRRYLRPGELGKAALRRVLQADPAAAEARVARSRRDRYVRLTDPVDGTAGVYARLRAEDAAAAFQRLDLTARGMRSQGDDRSLDTLRADLFVESMVGRSMVRIRQSTTTTGPPRATPATPPTPTSTTSPTATPTTPPTATPTTPPMPVATTAPTAPPTTLPTTTLTTPPTATPPPVAPTETTRSPVWRSRDGSEPLFGVGPPRAHDPDPPPDDPVWDRYLPPADPEPSAQADSPDPPRSEPLHPEPLRPDPEPGTWRQPLAVEVQVVLSLATLLGLDEQPGLLRGYGAVPAATVLDIVETAEAAGGTTSLRGLFCDPLDGRLLTMESRARFFTGGLRRFCAWRDQADRLTGGHLADIDHILATAHGGRTTAANGQGLGQRANRILKQHRDVSVTALPVLEGHDEQHRGLAAHRASAPDVAWELPSGCRHVSKPPPALGLGSDPQDDPPAAADAEQVVEQELLAQLDAQGRGISD